MKIKFFELPFLMSATSFFGIATAMAMDAGLQNTPFALGLTTGAFGIALVVRLFFAFF